MTPSGSLLMSWSTRCRQSKGIGIGTASAGLYGHLSALSPSRCPAVRLPSVKGVQAPQASKVVAYCHLPSITSPFTKESHSTGSAAEVADNSALYMTRKVCKAVPPAHPSHAFATTAGT